MTNIVITAKLTKSHFSVKSWMDVLKVNNLNSSNSVHSLSSVASVVLVKTGTGNMTGLKPRWPHL